MDAKLCDDGKTVVGRKGPRCEFEECPKPKINLISKLSFYILTMTVLCSGIISCCLISCWLLSVARKRYLKRLKELNAETQLEESNTATRIYSTHNTKQNTSSFTFLSLSFFISLSALQEVKPEVASQSQQAVIYYQPTMPVFAQPMPFSEQ
jgi:hypothetical protein